MSRPRTYRPRVEGLEARCLPSTFTVTNLLDNQAGDPLIAGSLRQRIDQAYPPAANGRRLLRFPRLFVVAVRG